MAPSAALRGGGNNGTTVSGLGVAFHREVVLSRCCFVARWDFSQRSPSSSSSSGGSWGRSLVQAHA